MKAQRLLPLMIGMVLAGGAYARNAEKAATLVSSAVREAKAEHKGVIVIFHASWCGWCKQLDKSMDVPAFKSVLSKDFVVLHVTVMEDKNHLADENPGGVDLMTKMGGANAGLPFFAALSSDGQVVADSKLIEPGSPKPQNMGFPTEKIEIDHFLAMLKAANPQVSNEDEASVRQVLTDRAAEIKSHLGH